MNSISSNSWAYRDYTEQRERDEIYLIDSSVVCTNPEHWEKSLSILGICTQLEDLTNGWDVLGRRSFRFRVLEVNYRVWDVAYTRLLSLHQVDSWSSRSSPGPRMPTHDWGTRIYEEGKETLTMYFTSFLISSLPQVCDPQTFPKFSFMIHWHFREKMSCTYRKLRLNYFDKR